MIKKIFTSFLATVILLSSFTSVLAMKKEETQGNRNIYALWGDFETEASLNMVKLSANKGAKLSISKGGANGSSGALRYDGVDRNHWDDITLPFYAVIGETYKFTVDIKCLTPGVSKLSYIINRKNGYNQYYLPLSGANTWETIEFTYEAKAPNQKGDDGGEILYMNMRFDETFPCSVLIDNLSVVPEGNVPGVDYSSVNKGFTDEKAQNKDDDKNSGIIKTEAVEFSDVTGHWAEQPIESLAKYGYLNGIGNGEFAPETYVTRAQFIKMMVDLHNIRYPEYDGRFSDVSGEEWFADLLYYADSLGYINVAMKYGGNIKPNQPITREEAASVAVKLAKERGAVAKNNVSFADEEDISFWAKKYVEESASLGIISGYEDKTFKPLANITRAEAAQILFRVVEISSRMSIYVDAQKGNDKNQGTKSEPLKTVYAARDMAAKYKDTMQNDITIFIRGEQYLDKTFELDEDNSGGNGYSIIYTSWDDEKAVFTMAKKFTDFTIHDTDKNIWKTFIGLGTYSRQAYFNDVRGIRARTVGYLKNVDYIDMKYYLCDDKELLDLKYPAEVDGVFNTLWLQPRFLVSDISEQDGRVRIDFVKYFHENKGRVDYDGTKNTRRQTPSYLENAYEFLDQKGEWYINQHDGFLYYIPRDGENMEEMECKIPLGEEMIVAQGSSYEKSLENVTFDNIVFEGTTWLGPDRIGGHSPRQNNLYGGFSSDDRFNYGADGQSPGTAVHFEKCKNITLSNNLFRQLGINGLQVFDGAKYVDIIGNEFCDISASAILIDDVEDTGFPSMRSEDSFVEYVNVTNNYIHNVSIDYQSSAAFTWAWPRHSKFNHNEIAYTQYSGTHTAWGWHDYEATGSILYDVEMNYNYIHDIMVGRVNDGAGMYSVGKSSFECDQTPDAKNNGANKNRIVGNYLVNGWQSDLIYPDQNSGMWYIADNVADVGPYRKEIEYNFDRETANPEDSYWMHMWQDTIKWMTVENNYATHDYAYKQGYMQQKESYVEPVNIHADRNWPSEANAIIRNAGIEPEFRDNFKLSGPKMFVSNDRWQDIEVGVPVNSGLMVLGDYNTKYPISDFDIDFWCSELGAVTLDKNGMLTAHKEGEFEAEAFVIIDGMVMSQHFVLRCYEGVSDVRFNVSTVNLLNGYETTLTATSYTSIGDGFNIMNAEELSVDVHSQDESIATFKLNEAKTGYILKAVADGATCLKGTITYQGKVYDINIPVKIISYGSKEAESLPFTKYNLTNGWTNNEGGSSGNGLVVSSKKSHYTAKQINNELIAFDMVINPGNSWPSIAFCDSDFMGSYSTNDCYMIGFKEEYIELQRWNKGERTMIYGDATYSPIGGAGVPNTDDDKIFEYNKRYSVVLGAINTDEGTRIILTINGKNIIDYLDNDEKRIGAFGYIVSYNPAPGGTTFYPYTGITDAE